MNLFIQTAIREVYDCHVLIQEWFHGTDQATPELFGKMMKMFSPSFSMINPNGGNLTYTDLELFLSKMRGVRPVVRIEVTEPVVIFAGDNSCVLRYEEFQHMESITLHRISTAIFTSDGIDGVLWQSLHETWVLN